MKIKQYLSIFFLGFLLVSSSSFVEAGEIDTLADATRGAEGAFGSVGADASRAADRLASMQSGLAGDAKALDAIGTKSKALTDALNNTQNLDAAAQQTAIDQAQKDLHDAMDAAQDARSERLSTKFQDEDPEKAAKIRKAQQDLKAARASGDAEKIKAAQENLDETLDDAQGIKRSRGAKALQWLKESKGVGALKWLGEQLPMVAIFTVPNILQAAMQAEAQKAAALETAAKPLLFGNWVVQMCGSCLDLDNPMQSIPLYEMIPVADVGDPIAGDTSTAFNGSIGSEVEQEHGGMVKAHYKRYDVKNEVEFYKKTKFVMSYPTQYYNNIGQTMITDPQFSGVVIDMNEGDAVDGTGEHYNAVFPVPLVPMKANAPSIDQQPVTPVSHELPGILVKLKESGLVQTYTASTFSSSGGPSVSDIVAAYFDADDETGISKDKGQNSVVQKALDSYATGVASAGPFGAVVPLFGWGDQDYQKIINSQSFPHNVPLSYSQTGVVVTDLGKAFAGHQKLSAKERAEQAAGGAKEQFAPKANYAAQGCWIYLCTDTPFTRSLHTGSKKLSPMGSYVDYVVFFDDQMNQVPGQIPVEKQIPGVSEDIKWPYIALNPNAKYMASLLSVGLADFEVEYQGQMIPVMYDVQTGERASMGDLPSKVGQAIQELQQAFPLLYDQFKAHRNALVSKYHYGPFVYGNVKLTEATNYEVAVAQGHSTINLKFYDGANCYGSPAQDLLLPMTTKGGTAVLPNSQATYFVSLVTDIEYEVGPDKTLKPANFSHAPGAWDGKSFKLDKRSADLFYWFDKISQNKGANKNDIMRLKEYIEQQREAWFETFDPSELSQGFSTGKLNFKLSSDLDRKDAERTGCYVYDVVPSPSASIIDKDWFIVSDSAKPTLEELRPLNIAHNTSSAQSVISLVTGYVYDLNGNLKMVHGRPMVVITTGAGQKESTGAHLFDYMSTMYPVGRGMSERFVADYKASLEQYIQDINQPLMQGEFGGVPLGIYAGDLSMHNYVYFDARGLTTESNFIPKDLFVTVNTAGGKTDLGAPLSKKTEYMVSLISGEIYARSGPHGTMDQKTVWSYANSQSFYWRTSLKAMFDQLKVGYISQQAVDKRALQDERERRAMASQKITLTQAEVQQVISRLSSFLPVPYNTLKQDPVTGMFVHEASIATSTGTQKSYIFFNVPNTFKDPDGKSVPLGAIYDQTGTLAQTLSGATLLSLMHQFGLCGDAEKVLGVPMTQPTLLMDESDYTLKPGESGKSMVVSTSDNFPGRQVKMPSGYFLYYSIMMNTYFVLNVAKNQWTSVVGGNLYDRQGRAIPQQNSVAKNITAKGVVNDIMLLEQNDAGQMQGLMQNPYHNNLFTQFINDGDNEWKSAYGTASVASDLKRASKTRGGAAKGDVYTVMFENSSKTRQERRTYEVDPAYQWESLDFLPLTTDDEIIKALPERSYLKARLVKHNDKVVNIVFNGVMYDVKQSSQPGVYAMQPIGSSDPYGMALQLLTDQNTHAPYVQVVVGSGKNAKAYRYGYTYQHMDKKEETDFRNFVQGDVTVCPVDTSVGPMLKREAKVGAKTITINYPTTRTFTLFTANIANPQSLSSISASSVEGAPASDSSGYESFSSMLFRVSKSDDGRFFATMYKNDGKAFHEPFVKYFDENGYVDLRNGALFDSTGKAVGSSLKLQDLTALLDKLQVTVNTNKAGKTGLFYKRPAMVKSSGGTTVAKVASPLALKAPTSSVKPSKSIIPQVKGTLKQDHNVMAKAPVREMRQNLAPRSKAVASQPWMTAKV